MNISGRRNAHVCATEKNERPTAVQEDKNESIGNSEISSLCVKPKQMIGMKSKSVMKGRPRPEDMASMTDRH